MIDDERTCGKGGIGDAPAAVCDECSAQLEDGGVVTADENYLRESILTPEAKVAAGYQPVMPAFQGLVTEEQLLALIEYIKSLSTQQENATP